MRKIGNESNGEEINLYARNWKGNQGRGNESGKTWIETTYLRILTNEKKMGKIITVAGKPCKSEWIKSWLQDATYILNRVVGY